MKKQPYELYSIVCYSVIFDDPPKSLEFYLSGISRALLLDAYSYVLGFHQKNSKYDNFREALNIFFSPANQRLVEQIGEKLEKLQNERKILQIIFNPLTSLRLFEFAFENATEPGIELTLEVEINMFKAYLLLNERITLNNIFVTSTENLDPAIKYQAGFFSQSFPYSELVNFNKEQLIICQIIKSIYLFEFLESYPPLLNQFLVYYDRKDWKEYLKYLLRIVFTIDSKHKEGYNELTIVQNDEYSSTKEFIEKLTITDSQAVAQYDFTSIRSRPYYQISEGNYREIYSLFLIEIIHKGMYFKLNEINKSLPTGESLRDWRRVYCHDFSERYLLYQILDAIYSKPHVKFTGTDISSLGIDAEPDYYLRKNNTLFLFESKDILINSEIKHSGDYALYELAFKNKLYYEKKGTHIKPRAILQLIRNIERALNRDFNFDQNYKEKSLNIYPILILHDHQYNVPGLNFLLNSWFIDELEKLKSKGLNISRVQLVTIIDIDTLIFYQDLLKEKKISLDLIIDAYFKYTRFNLKKKYQNEGEVKFYKKRTLISFALFIANYCLEQRLKVFPKMIKEKGYILFN